MTTFDLLSLSSHKGPIITSSLSCLLPTNGLTSKILSQSSNCKSNLLLRDDSSICRSHDRFTIHNVFWTNSRNFHTTYFNIFFVTASSFLIFWNLSIRYISIFLFGTIYTTFICKKKHFPITLLLPICLEIVSSFITLQKAESTHDSSQLNHCLCHDQLISCCTLGILLNAYSIVALVKPSQAF